MSRSFAPMTRFFVIGLKRYFPPAISKKTSYTRALTS
jgi:hypothetical protein